MAKQTFTTGQVLTAAQMTSLQQTAMGGGSTTAKTTSYVLLAADAGTVVQMNAAGATTITVNTALFSAGDTVQIQNVGAGVCTITAGTATVSTSAVLTLKQYDAGTLYFNTTSAAIFFAVDAADSPLTTKGDLYTYSTVNDRLAVGTNGQYLTADSTAATGLKWAAAAAGASMTLISTTTLSGATVTLSSIPQTYLHLQIYIASATNDTADGSFRIGINGSTNNYAYFVKNYKGTAGNEDAGWVAPNNTYTRTNSTNFQHYNIYNYATDTGWKTFDGAGGFFSANDYKQFQNGGYIYTAGAALSSLVLSNSGGNFSGGTVYLYGVK